MARCLYCGRTRGPGGRILHAVPCFADPEQGSGAAGETSPEPWSAIDFSALGRNLSRRLDEYLKAHYFEVIGRGLR